MTGQNLTDFDIPPQHLRIRVGPFSDATLFRQSGDRMAAEIIGLCGIGRAASILEVGCGCGRLVRALAGHVATGSYDGFDVSAEMIAWCQRSLQAHLPNVRFTWVDAYSPDQNPAGLIKSKALAFPYPDGQFDTAIVSSVFTHMMPDEIEHYIAELARVLKPEGCCFVTAFLFDAAGEAAVASGTTIFDFRHPIGPCLTFHRCEEELRSAMTTADPCDSLWPRTAAATETRDRGRDGTSPARPCSFSRERRLRVRRYREARTKLRAA